MGAHPPGIPNGSRQTRARAPHEVLALQATGFLREHYREPISIHDLSDHLSYSPSQLTRSFTRAVGTPPIRYLASWRLHEAKRLLISEGLDVAEACYEVGYSSIGTFSRRFTRDVGLPPAALRRSADWLAEVSLPPVSLLRPTTTRVRVRVVVPSTLREQLGTEPYQWVGTFPTPMPCGPPCTGTLRRGLVEVLLPVAPGAPWLQVALIPGGADVTEHLAPREPLVARPHRLSDHDDVVAVEVGPARPWEHPMLVALPALWPG
ncbi:AraC family transcriptional regulator [Actinomyces bowdenii]|uniref:AraC family transcriptional regulator n=1 Tax=Actinomyces bowdenii TaxID=131109 RepID=A0A3P1V4C4_9ACTO|nr:AraC family transcriptional regulator [Actinomyces bowdenii]